MQTTDGQETDVNELRRVESDLKQSIETVNEKSMKDINRFDRKIDEQEIQIKKIYKEMFDAVNEVKESCKEMEG